MKLKLVETYRRVSDANVGALKAPDLFVQIVEPAFELAHFS
jgi:hypothetical protein